MCSSMSFMAILILSPCTLTLPETGDGLSILPLVRLPGFHELAGREVAAVARAADAVLRVAAQRRPDADALHAGVDDDLRELAVDLVAARRDELALGVLDLLREQAAEHAVLERLLTERVVG